VADTVIRVEDLGKSFRILHEPRHDTLRDAIVHVCGRVFRRPHATDRGARATAEDFWALRGLSFEVGRGEVVGIIGRNGAGKSTLLKILSRITRPTEGLVETRGRIGSLLEVGTGFHPELTGRENIFLNGAILGMRRSEILGKFDDIVAFSEIERFLDTPVKRYSSGMYTRLAFAVAAHLEPEILIVDEVLAVGDAQFQRKCLAKMGDVARGGRTVLFVSHNMAAVEQLCSRAILLAQGHITAAGDVERVVSAYAANAEPAPAEPGGVMSRSADGAIELLSVTPSDETAGPLTSVLCGRPVRITLGFRVSRAIPRATVAVGINSLYEQRVALLESAMAGQMIRLEPGLQEVVCEIPDFPLSPGAYLLDVKVVAGREPLLWAPRAAKLDVQAADFHNTGRLADPAWGGFVQLHQTWRVSTPVVGAPGARAEAHRP
jgi:lipopolysaccharide transport system ATP-binding protein